MIFHPNATGWDEAASLAPPRTASYDHFRLLGEMSRERVVDGGWHLTGLGGSVCSAGKVSRVSEKDHPGGARVHRLSRRDPARRWPRAGGAVHGADDVVIDHLPDLWGLCSLPPRLHRGQQRCRDRNVPGVFWKQRAAAARSEPWMGFDRVMFDLLRCSSPQDILRAPPTPQVRWFLE